MPRPTLRPLLIACLLPLTMGASLLTSCASPSSHQSGKQPAASQPLDVTLQPGQRIEAVIVEPAHAIKRRRVRGIIDANHQLTLDTLGTFDTRHRTLTGLQQMILLAHNHHRRLQGTIRLVAVQRETAGLFIALRPAQQQEVLDDPAQVALLEQDHHPTLQWIALREEDASPTLSAEMREGKLCVLARAADLELVGHALALNVQEQVLQQGLITQATQLYSVKLHPAAGEALARVSRESTGQHLLVVHQDRCVWQAQLVQELGGLLTLTSGPEGFTGQQLEAFDALFKPTGL